MSQLHYLETELYDLVRSDRTIFDFLQSGALDGVWYWDLERPENEWMSTRFWQTFGYDPDSKQHLAAEWQNMIHPDDLQTALQNFKEHCVNPSHPYDQVVRYQHKNGSTVWVRCRGIAIRAPNGQPKRMLGTHTDVTAIKQTEAELQNLTTELQLSNHRFQSLVELAPDGIVLATVQGNIVLANAQTEKLFGYSRAELLDQPIEMLMPQRFRQRHLGHRAAYLQTPSSRPMGLGLELCGLHKSGAEFPIAISLNQLNLDGEILVLTSIRDVSDYRRAEQQILALNDELTERNTVLNKLNQELEAFAYSVSHDLRAPLRSIDGFSRILLEDHSQQLDAEGRRILNVVCDSAAKMGRLIDELLMFSRLSRRAMNAQPVDMTELAQEAYHQAQQLEQTRQIDFKLTELPTVNGDRALLRQVWANLLGNAVKYTRTRSAALIEVKGWLHGREAHYQISDNGVGFDMKYVHKLFGVFERLHGDDEFEGTGVGLALVQRIVDRHGGRAWAEGAIDQGSRFYFTLPLESPT